MSHPARDYNQEAKDVAERKYAYDFDGVLRRYMMRTFAPYLRPGKSLEMGCYHGEFTEILLQHCPDLTVLEAAEDCLHEASKRVNNRAKFIQTTFESHQASGLYDNIFLSHTLEHLDDPIGVLQQVNRWLSPTGRLFLVCPNANAPSRQIAVKMGLITHNAAVTDGEAKHGHRCTYSLDTLERDARASGLSVLTRGGVFFKALANFQFDRLMGTEVMSEGYLEGCYQLGQIYPDLCASVYVIAEKGA